MLANALKEHQAGNLDLAKKLYLDIIKATPKDYKALHLLGILLAQRQEFTESLGFIEQALKINPESSELHNCMGDILRNLNQYEAAVLSYQKALQLNPDSNTYNLACKNLIYLLHKLGVTLINEKKYEEAIFYFKEILSLQPEHAEALSNLGAIFLLQKDPVNALPYFLKLLKLTQDFDVYYNIGVIYMDLSRFDEAVIYFCEAIKIQPDSFAAHANLGVIYLRRQDFFEAKKYYKLAYKLQPENQEISYILAALEQKDNLSKAPNEYVQHLFDEYAPYFERHLKLLNYQVPQLLFNAVQIYINADSKISILDLGCGTGICGVEFEPVAKELIGVDISKGMLELARQKNVYTDLKNMSIEKSIGIFFNIDLIIAVESLVYFGDLEKIFKDSYSALKSGGIFACTVEKTDKYPYTLQQTARFAHNLKYINELAEYNNFISLKINEIVLRRHYETDIKGYIFIFKRTR